MPDQRPRLADDATVPRRVFVAPGRAARPIEIPGSAELATCPFCAGHEHLTPGEVARLPEAAALPWSARIIPNRYPVVADGDDALAAASDRSPAAGPPAHGVHEVLVESPRHDTCILTVAPAAWRLAWEACRRRLAELAARGDLAWTTVFKNSGPAAGASLAHVHSQLVGLGFIPPVVAAELAGAVAPFSCHLDEAAAEERVVASAGELVALVPRAPRQPYEVWIVPRAPRPWFHADADAAGALADLTRDVVGRIRTLAPGADYNWWLHQAPLVGATPPGWHWHLEILPRLSGIAGFELATGCHITTVGAAESARRLTSIRRP